jgi:hypothetical protein
MSITFPRSQATSREHTPPKQWSEIRLKKWADIRNYDKHGWLYRGQNCEQWDLTTSLERTCDRLCVKHAARRDAEDRIVRQFRRPYHQYALHIPVPGAAIESL